MGKHIILAYNIIMSISLMDGGRERGGVVIYYNLFSKVSNEFDHTL